MTKKKYTDPMDWFNTASDTHWMRLYASAGDISVTPINMSSNEFELNEWRILADAMYKRDVQYAISERELHKQFGIDPITGKPKDPVKAVSFEDCMSKFSADGGYEHRRLCAIAAVFLLKHESSWMIEELYPFGSSRSDVCDPGKCLFIECGNSDSSKMIEAADCGLASMWMPYPLNGEFALLFKSTTNRIRLRYLGDSSYRSIWDIHTGDFEGQKTASDGVAPERVAVGKWDDGLLSFETKDRSFPVVNMMKSMVETKSWYGRLIEYRKSIASVYALNIDSITK